MSEVKLKVELLDYTPDPERLIAASAKVCYSSVGMDEITEGLNDDATAKFLDMLSDIGHESPIEHAAFTFGIEGVSRSLLAQITRHRIASYSVRSQRYVNEADFSYIVPPDIAKLPEAEKAFTQAMNSARNSYSELVGHLVALYIEEYLKEGKNDDEAFRLARRKAGEDARFVLPNACETKLVVTMNARSLNNFFQQRCCNRAQWEIRDLATKMLSLVREKAPNLFKNSGPACYSTGRCPEGNMTCGKIAEVKKRFEMLDKQN